MKNSYSEYVFFLSGFWAKAVDVTIVESQSGNFWNNTRFGMVHGATSLGFNATIVPQSALDSISNFASTDVFDLFHPQTIMYTGRTYQTIEQYVLSGRPAYIQSEYSGIFIREILRLDSLMQDSESISVGPNSITKSHSNECLTEYYLQPQSGRHAELFQCRLFRSHYRSKPWSISRIQRRVLWFLLFQCSRNPGRS